MSYIQDSSTYVITGSTFVPGIIDMIAIVVKTGPCSIMRGSQTLFTLPVGAYYLELRSTEGLTFTNDCTIFSRLSSHRASSDVTYNVGGGGGGGTWGSITGSLNDQTDLQAELDTKLNIQHAMSQPVDGLSGYDEKSYLTVNIEPTANAPTSFTKASVLRVNLDNNNSGFDIGTGGNAATLLDPYFRHVGSSDVGALEVLGSYSEIGNGSTPITLSNYNGIIVGGEFNNGVEITGGLSGHGFSPNVKSGVTLSGYSQAYHDSANFSAPISYHTSFQASPNITSIPSKRGYTTVNATPIIGDVAANAGMNGIHVNPTISNFQANAWYNGVYSSTENITGAGTNKYAGYFKGDVHVDGDLSFTGAFSIGALNAYKSQNIIDGGGNPTSAHSLVSGFIAPPSSTITNADTFGVNTAALMDIDSNATVTSGPFGLGLVGLGLPAVVTTKTGSSVDNIGGAAFAINFDASSTGGTVNQGYGGMFTAIPNGITAVSRWYGMWSRMPFGPAATDTWGIYSEGCDNQYFNKGVKIGGADKVTNTSIDLEVEDKLTVIGRGDTTARNALTAINGSLWYNTTTDKFQGYAGGTWVDLH